MAPFFYFLSRAKPHRNHLQFLRAKLSKSQWMWIIYQLSPRRRFIIRHVFRIRFSCRRKATEGANFHQLIICNIPPAWVCCLPRFLSRFRVISLFNISTHTAHFSPLYPLTREGVKLSAGERGVKKRKRQMTGKEKFFYFLSLLHAERMLSRVKFIVAVICFDCGFSTYIRPEWVLLAYNSYNDYYYGGGREWEKNKRLAAFLAFFRGRNGIYLGAPQRAKKSVRK